MKYHVKVAKAPYLHGHITIKLTGRFVRTNIDYLDRKIFLYMLSCRNLSNFWNCTTLMEAVTPQSLWDKCFAKSKFVIIKVLISNLSITLLLKSSGGPLGAMGCCRPPPPCWLEQRSFARKQYKGIMPFK